MIGRAILLWNELLSVNNKLIMAIYSLHGRGAQQRQVHVQSVSTASTSRSARFGLCHDSAPGGMYITRSSLLNGRR